MLERRCRPTARRGPVADRLAGAAASSARLLGHLRGPEARWTQRDRRPEPTLAASRARAAAVTTSCANRERITPNRSTWRGWVRIANMIAWENIARLS